MTIMHRLVLSPIGRFIPFYFCQDNYHGGIQTLYVWRWGKLTIEKYRWYRYNHDSFYGALSGLSRKNKYKVLTRLAARIS